jgi:hypothetical protein
MAHMQSPSHTEHTVLSLSLSEACAETFERVALAGDREAVTLGITTTGVTLAGRLLFGAITDLFWVGREEYHGKSAKGQQKNSEFASGKKRTRSCKGVRFRFEFHCAAPLKSILALAK